jgi:hypothetical protein
VPKVLDVAGARPNFARITPVVSEMRCGSEPPPLWDGAAAGRGADVPARDWAGAFGRSAPAIGTSNH